MISLRSLALALPASLVLLLGGCDDGTSPSDLGGLDPLALVDGLNQLVAPLQASGEATANLQEALPALTAAGISLLPPEFPTESAGQTFAYDVDAGGFRVDSARGGAPPEGVRVLWYALDGSGEIRQPLELNGRIDLEPREGGASDSLALTVMGPDNETLLDLVQGSASTDDDVVTEFTATGAYSGASRTVDFIVTSDATRGTATGDEDHFLRVALEDPDTQYELQVEGTVGGVSGDTTDVVTATAVRNGATTVMELSFRTAGDSGVQDVSGTLSHDGTLIAKIAVVGSTYRFSKPNGDSFSAGQASELNTLFGAMTRTGFLVLLNLPLFQPGF